MKTCILVANEDEARHIQEITQATTNTQIVIVGEGRSQVLATLSRYLKDGTIAPDDRVINVGYVGANGYHKGDVVRVKSVRHLYPSTTIREPTLTLPYTSDALVAECYTADNFVNKDGFDMTLRGVIDMELYYMALMFPEVRSVKIVSDELDYHDYKAADLEQSWQVALRLIQADLMA